MRGIALAGSIAVAGVLSGIADFGRASATYSSSADHERVAFALGAAAASGSDHTPCLLGGGCNTLLSSLLVSLLLGDGGKPMKRCIIGFIIIGFIIIGFIIIGLIIMFV